MCQLYSAIPNPRPRASRLRLDTQPARLLQCACQPIGKKENGGLVGVYDQIKTAFQDIIAPELHTIRSDIQRVDQKIDSADARLNTKLDGLKAELLSEIRRLDGKGDNLKAELLAEIRRLDEKIDGMDARLNQKIDGMDARLNEKIDGMDARLTTKIDSMKAELISEIRRLDARIDALDRELKTAIDVRERLVALEAKIRS